MSANQLPTIRAYKSARTKVTREVLRRQIDGMMHLDKLMECAKFYQGMRAFELNPATGQYLAPPPVDSTVLAAVKAEADLHLKLLNKVLPDLKAIEMKDTIGQAQVNGRLMTDTELVHRLMHLGVTAAAAIACDDDDITIDSLF
jgi:hypothetical protein